MAAALRLLRRGRPFSIEPRRAVTAELHVVASRKTCSPRFNRPVRRMLQTGPSEAGPSAPTTSFQKMREAVSSKAEFSYLLNQTLNGVAPTGAFPCLMAHMPPHLCSLAAHTDRSRRVALSAVGVSCGLFVLFNIYSKQVHHTLQFLSLALVRPQQHLPQLNCKPSGRRKRPW